MKSSKFINNYIGNFKGFHKNVTKNRKMSKGQFRYEKHPVKNTTKK